MTLVPIEPLPICHVADIDEPEPDKRWLVEALWGRAAVGFLAGHPKLGKTWLGLDLALSVASGTPSLGRFEVHDPGAVLVYLAEDHPALVRQRLAGLCRQRNLDLTALPIHVITAPALRLDLERDRRRLAHAVQQIRPRLLLLDPLVRLHRKDENLASDVADLLAFLRESQRRYDLAVVVVHHMRKNGAGRPGQALRGSGDFHAWIDSGLYLRAQRDRVLLTAEHRDAPAPEPIEIRLLSSPDGSQPHLAIVGADSEPAPTTPSTIPLEHRLIELLRSVSQPLTRPEIRQRLRVNNQRLGVFLAQLQEQGLVARSQKGWAFCAEKDVEEKAPKRSAFRSTKP